MFGLARNTSTQRSRRLSRRGVSLIEALLASAVLAIIVLSVGAAVSAGRDVAFEGQKMILGAVAADNLMAELIAEDYADLDDYDGLDQSVGSMQTLGGADYPDTFWAIGRSVSVVEEIIDLEDVPIGVRGKTVTVSAYDEFRVLASVETFIPEPAS